MKIDSGRNFSIQHITYVFNLNVRPPEYEMSGTRSLVDKTRPIMNLNMLQIQTIISIKFSH